MSAQAAFEVPVHHSLPFVVRAFVLRFQISNSETQNCSRKAQEENLDGTVIVLAMVSSREPGDSMLSGVDYSLPAVFAKRHRSEEKESASPGRASK
jgi:hypothetical protein